MEFRFFSHSTVSLDLFSRFSFSFFLSFPLNFLPFIHLSEVRPFFFDIMRVILFEEKERSVKEGLEHRVCLRRIQVYVSK